MQLSIQLKVNYKGDFNLEQAIQCNKNSGKIQRLMTWQNFPPSWNGVAYRRWKSLLNCLSQPVWSDWVIFISSGNKLPHKSSPNILGLFKIMSLLCKSVWLLFGQFWGKLGNFYSIIRSHWLRWRMAKIDDTFHFHWPTNLLFSSLRKMLIVTQVLGVLAQTDGWWSSTVKIGRLFCTSLMLSIEVFRAKSPDWATFERSWLQNFLTKVGKNIWQLLGHFEKWYFAGKSNCCNLLNNFWKQSGHLWLRHLVTLLVIGPTPSDKCRRSCIDAIY